MDKLKARYEEVFEKVKEELISGKWNNWRIKNTYDSTYLFSEEIDFDANNINKFKTTSFDETGKAVKINERAWNIFPTLDFDAHKRTQAILKSIYKVLPNDPYWAVMEKLHPIWADNNIPVLRKEPEMEKAFRALVYGEDSQDQESPGKEPEKTAGEGGENNNNEYIYFIDKGATWEVGKKDETKDIHNTKGIIMIQHLLLNPRVHVKNSHLDSLVNLNAKGLEYSKKLKKTTENEDDSDSEMKHKPEKDKVAAQLKKEIAEMRREYQQAQDESRPDVNILKKELEEKIKIYNSLYDRDGKPREDSKDDEKIRKRVDKNINTAKENILKELPCLNDHLKHIESSGYSKIYNLPAHKNPIQIKTDRK